jgi:hypothetical protein
MNFCRILAWVGQRTAARLEEYLHIGRVWAQSYPADHVGIKSMPTKKSAEISMGIN